MKKRYTVVIVVIALLAFAGIGYFIYNKWSEIQKILAVGVSKIKKIKFPVVKAKPVRPVDAAVILAAPKTDAKLAADQKDLQKADAVIKRDTADVSAQIIGTVRDESKQKAAKGQPISDIVVDNTKQREAKAQAGASGIYTDIIKQIEIEKAKSAVLLTAIRTETEKKQRIDALDLEMELYPENRLRDRRVRRPLSKSDAEYLVASGVV
jgi:hypothetical protein